MQNSSKFRVVSGIISLLLSIYPLYILYHTIMWWFPSNVLSTSVTGNYPYLTLLSFPLFFLGIFLIFRKFDYRPVKLLILSSVGYSCLAFSLPVFIFASTGSGELWPIFLFGSAFGIFLIALGITLIAISYSKSKKYLTGALSADGKVALIAKLLLLLLIVVSPILINQLLVKSSSISSVRIMERELFESPDGSGSIVYVDTDGSGATLNLTNSETRVIYPNLIWESDGWIEQAYQKLLPKIEFVHETDKYKLDQTFLVVKATGERIHFPVEGVHDCTFLAGEQYVACFAYVEGESMDEILYFVPIESIIK